MITVPGMSVMSFDAQQISSLHIDIDNHPQPKFAQNDPRNQQVT